MALDGALPVFWQHNLHEMVARQQIAWMISCSDAGRQMSTCEAIGYLLYYRAVINHP